ARPGTDAGRRYAAGDPPQPGRHGRLSRRVRRPRVGHVTAAAPPVLDVSGLWVHYGAVPAVRDLSLSVGEAEIVGLIGPNGAGKSTTLHAITGLVGPRAGDIRLRGRSTLGRKPETIARYGVSLVPEGRRIFAEL